MLAKYNEAFPDCAERIVAMAERQAAHRHQLETTHIQASHKSERLGQVFGFTLGLVTILSGVGLIAVGKDVQGLAAIVVAIGGLAGVFVYGRMAQTKEREKKREQSLQLPLPYGQQENS